MPMASSWRSGTESVTRQIGVERGLPVLGQAAPPATTPTDIYTCPKKYTASGIVVITERGGSPASFRIALRANGDALANEHYVAYDRAIAANDTLQTATPLDLDEDDVITVYASSANLSFSFFGIRRPKDVA